MKARDNGQNQHQKFFFAVFFIHGLLGLICQVLWQRELILVLGGSVYSTALILMSYMAGLALGNLAAGRWLSRFGPENRLYGMIQCATGIFVLAFPGILHILQGISGLYFPLVSEHHFMFLLIQATVTFLVLVIPTTLIGAGFPVMVSLFEKIQVSKNIFIGKLNFLNSLGSGFGALLTGFLFIRWFGSRLTLLGAGTLFLLTGILVYRFPGQPKTGQETNREKPPGEARLREKLDIDIDIRPRNLQILLAVLFFFSGFSALSYELLYNRILVYFLGNTTFSFTLIVTFFILGYSLGNFFFYKFFKRQNKLSVYLVLFILIQILISLYHILLPVALPLLQHVLILAKSGLTRSGWNALTVEFFIRMVSSFLVLTAPAFLFGAVFPLVYRVYFGVQEKRLSEKQTGKTFGRLNAINTLGSVAGPFVTGFLFIALFQVSLTMRIISLVNMLLGFVLLGYIFRRPKRLPFGWIRLPLLFAVWILLLVVIPLKNQLAFRAARQSTSDSVIFFREGVSGTVSVSVTPQNVKLLKINGVGEVPTDHDSMRAFRMLAYLPFMAHDHPRNLLSIAFGGGITFGSIANTGLPEMICVEICRDVLDAAPLYSRENNRVYQNQRVRILVQDGRNYIQNIRKTFDIITSDATHPASFDSWVLYTREFYQACRKKLNSRGIMAQWIPLHGLSTADYRSILKTFSDVFAYNRLYLANAYTIIMGSDEPIRLKNENFLRWTGTCDNIRLELGRVNIGSLSDLEDCLLLDHEALRRFSSAGSISSDLFSPLQFAELRTLKKKNTLEENLSALLHFRRQNGLGNPSLDSYLTCRILVEAGEITRALEVMQKLDEPKKSPETGELQKRILKEMALRRVPELIGQNVLSDSVHRLEYYMEQYPDEGYFQAVLGYLVSKQKKLEKALELMRRAVELSPWHPGVQKIALRFFLDAGKNKSALTAVENLLRQNPRDRGLLELKKDLNKKIAGMPR